MSVPNTGNVSPLQTSPGEQRVQIFIAQKPGISRFLRYFSNVLLILRTFYTISADQAALRPFAAESASVGSIVVIGRLFGLNGCVHAHAADRLHKVVPLAHVLLAVEELEDVF